MNTRYVVPAAILLVGGLALVVAGPGQPDATPDGATAATAAPHAGSKPAAFRGVKPAPSGPVDVRSIWLGEDGGSLSLRFRVDADDVRVRVYGTDGLVVTSDQFPVVDGSFLAGDEHAIDVEFGSTTGAAHQNLAVQIEGRFGGRALTLARSFTIGAPLPERTTPESAPVHAEVDGKRVPMHRMPAAEKKR